MHHLSLVSGVMSTTFDNFTSRLNMMFESFMGLLRWGIRLRWFLREERIYLRDGTKCGNRGGIGAKVKFGRGGVGWEEGRGL